MTYEPEYSQSYELSYKGTLLDDRLTLNANLFYTKYEDQQIEIRPRLSFRDIASRKMPRHRAHGVLKSNRPIR